MKLTKQVKLTKRLTTSILFTLLGAAVATAQTPEVDAAPAKSAKPKVEIVTSMGAIVVELDSEKAPLSVENFLGYVDAGFYDGTVFHRVIPSFMIQGGGFTADMTKKDVRAGIQNEADNGRKNTRGTVAMARTGDPHSASSQFFINHADNGPLDHTGKNSRGWGYAVFGDVVEGMDVVDAIAAVKTGSRGPFRDVPVEPVTIESIRRVE
ncbi:MAG: peptidyl-prolyl cis-trans isomerase [Thermoanaerobaculia bacterium]|nr:peptidyl-prolyl cis-trans isomerase [Thermoanaerobaculia bacterium]